ncbi:MAG: hypothetical protein SVT52_03515 [Planctomycetota bacterium]|nr:hypothetical protein [Planctomycetota bacterium]
MNLIKLSTFSFVCGVHLVEGLSQRGEIFKSVLPRVGIGQFGLSHAADLIDSQFSEAGNATYGALAHMGPTPVAECGGLSAAANGVEEHLLHQEHGNVLKVPVDGRPQEA